MLLPCVCPDPNVVASSGAWSSLKSAVLSSEFAKSPVAGIVVGVILLLMKDWYERHRARRTLLYALNTEARTTWNVVTDSLRRFPTRGEADKLVEGVRGRTLDFITLDSIPAGWVFFAPSFPLTDIMLKLKPSEAEAAVEYFDAWARLVQREARLSQVYTKLVDLTPSLAKPEHAMQLLEVAHQVRGSLRKLLNAAKDLAVQRHKLEKVTAKSLSWNPLVFCRRAESLLHADLDCPKDWDAAAPDVQHSLVSPTEPSARTEAPLPP